MKHRRKYGDNGNLTIGLIILVIGTVLLLRKMGIFFPGWVLSWPMIVIAIGMIILIKHRFKSGFAAFMVLFGTFFLLKRELYLPVHIDQYLLPVGLILLGLFIILNRKNRYSKNWDKLDNFGGISSKSAEKVNLSDSEGSKPGGSEGSYNDGGDYINSQALFCGIQKRVLSKNFRGGKASAIFGGTEIDLTQADLAEHSALEVEVAFGGLKLIIPPHWDLQVNVTNIFAGIEDKRMFHPSPTDPTKVLIINGTIVFGGLEIKSF